MYIYIDRLAIEVHSPSGMLCWRETLLPLIPVPLTPIPLIPYPFNPYPFNPYPRLVIEVPSPSGMLCWRETLLFLYKQKVNDNSDKFIITMIQRIVDDYDHEVDK
jgi:hypothetical protein